MYSYPARYVLYVAETGDRKRCGKGEDARSTTQQQKAAFVTLCVCVGGREERERGGRGNRIKLALSDVEFCIRLCVYVGGSTPFRAGRSCSNSISRPRPRRRSRRRKKWKLNMRSRLTHWRRFKGIEIFDIVQRYCESIRLKNLFRYRNRKRYVSVNPRRRSLKS